MAGGPAALGAFALTLFCFWRLFAALGAASPAGAGGSGPMEEAAPAILWLLAGCGFAGLTGVLLDRVPAPVAALRPGALRGLVRMGWEKARGRRAEEGSDAPRGE